MHNLRTSSLEKGTRNDGCLETVVICAMQAFDHSLINESRVPCAVHMPSAAHGNYVMRVKAVFCRYEFATRELKSKSISILEMNKCF